MRFTERRQRFRAVLAGDQCVHPGSVFDPISARIAEELGFEVGMFAGSIASFTVLGAPDLIVLTLTEFAAQAYRINRAGNLPLLVDVDHVYGHSLNVQRTVEALRAELKIPFILGSDASEVVELDYLGRQGVRVCLQGHQPFMAAVQAVHDTLKALRGGTPPGKLPGIAPAELMKRVTQEGDY